LGLMCGALMVAGSASAKSYTGPGGYHFFDYSGTIGDATWDYNAVSLGTGVSRTNNAFDQPDGEWSENDSGPDASHLQTFDVEEGFYSFVGDENGGDLYLGIVVGDYISTGRQNFESGDIFLSFGASVSPYVMAVGTAEGGADAGRLGDVWLRDSADFDTLDTTYFSGTTPSNGDPYRVNAVEGEDINGNTFINSGALVQWGQDASYGVHNFLSMCLTLGAVQSEQIINEGFSFHWTMECGNDIIDWTTGGGVTPSAPVVPVPAAAPMVLLGMGIVGAVRRNRKKSS